MKFPLAALFSLLTMNAFAGLQVFQGRWKECHKASECVVIKGVCGECEAVNVKFQSKSELHFRQRSMSVLCRPLKKNPPPMTAACFYNKCTCHR